MNRKLENVEKVWKEKERDIEKLHNLVIKLFDKIDDYGKTLPVIEEIDFVEETDYTNLDKTFVNPSSEINCEMCDFVAKNLQGLKIHKKAKHTKSKFHCVLCVFETNNKNSFNDHKASKFKKTLLCSYGCGESFEAEEEENEHIQKFHNKAKVYQCEKCNFETNVKKFFNDHKASKCLKTIICDFGCSESFEFVEELQEHMQTVHKW